MKTAGMIALGIGCAAIGAAGGFWFAARRAQAAAGGMIDSLVDKAEQAAGKVKDVAGFKDAFEGAADKLQQNLDRFETAADSDDRPWWATL